MKDENVIVNVEDEDDSVEDEDDDLPMDDEDLLYEICLAMGANPDKLRVTVKNTPAGKNLMIDCDPDDMRWLIGTDGRNIKGLRNIFRTIACRDGGRKTFVHLVENEEREAAQNDSFRNIKQLTDYAVDCDDLRHNLLGEINAH